MMGIIFILMAASAAGGVVRAIFQMRQRATEQKNQKAALEKFEREHPGS